MKLSYLKISCILLLLVLLSVILLYAFSASTAEQTTKEKEFLSSPDVATCNLEQTTVSKLDLPENLMASFINRMERDEREKIRRGQITLAGRPFLVLVAENPKSEFLLYDIEKEFDPYWWGSWSMYSYHKIDEDFYKFMLIENDTKLAARKYTGDFGIIRAGKGERELEKVEFNGSVHQKGNISAPIGIIEEHWTNAVTEYEIPAGDYTANLMNVTYDNLSITISNNYHTNAKGQSDGETVYGMEIRKDKPYVLDFSNEPMVIFDQPANDKTTCTRGDEIILVAVLIDPELDIMIRGLDDTSVKVDRELKNTDGEVISTVKVSKSLDPKVVITRANGEVINEGVMPFG